MFMFASMFKAILESFKYMQKTYTMHNKEALAWYGKLTWESAHTWILKILCYLIVWGITLIFMVRLSFYAIPLLIYDVISCIGWRNVLLNSYIIDKFAVA